jgi:SAM-dependent methyltransferase
MTTKEELIRYYSKKSKHSQYQELPSSLIPILGGHATPTKTRWESERLRYILNKVDVKGKSILDIGGNTGFFTFELLNAGAQHIDYYEGNKDHVDFVSRAAEVLEVNNNISINHRYYSFEESNQEFYDIVLLLNVLHHFGDDYGNKDKTLEESRKEIIYQLNSFKNKTDFLVFQLGFNWRGNPAYCLFENGTKQEMIDFINEGTKDNWDIIATGIAEREGGAMAYQECNHKNILRDDSLGEFLNRPIFILSSRAVSMTNVKR